MLTPEHAFATFVTQKGVAKPVGLDEIPSSGRSAQGSQVVDLARSDAVAAVQVVSPVVLAMDSPQLPPAPAPQPNGRGGRGVTGDGQAKTKAAASAGDKAPRAPRKRRRAGWPAKRQRSANRPRQRVPLLLNPKAERPRRARCLRRQLLRGNLPRRRPKPEARQVKSPPKAARDGAQETATNGAPARGKGTTKAAKPASAAPAAKPADELVQGRLIEEPSCRAFREEAYSEGGSGEQRHAQPEEEEAMTNSDSARF